MRKLTLRQSRHHSVFNFSVHSNLLLFNETKCEVACFKDKASKMVPSISGKPNAAVGSFTPYRSLNRELSDLKPALAWGLTQVLSRRVCKLSYLLPASPACPHCRFLATSSYLLEGQWGAPHLPGCFLTPGLSFGLPCDLADKESACNTGDLGLIPGLGRSPGEGKSYPLQYSSLGNSMECIVYGVAKSQTRLSDFHFTSLFKKPNYTWDEQYPSRTP